MQLGIQLLRRRKEKSESQPAKRSYGASNLIGLGEVGLPGEDNDQQGHSQRGHHPG